MLLHTSTGRQSASRVAHSLLVGVVAALSALLIALGSTVSAAIQLLAYTPIVMTGTFTSDPSGAYVARAVDDFIRPSRSADFPPLIPDYNTPIALDTPEQAWPITGLFDYTFGRSVRIGFADLRTQIAETTEASDGQPIIVFGYSQSAVISILEKRRLAALYPEGDPQAPDIQFVMIGDLNRPNGGVMTRFQGAYIPLINFYFNGPAPTNTNFKTVDIARQYDGFADFPLYPLNLVANLNALLGIFYVHTDYQAVSLDPTSDKYVEGTLQQRYGDTMYYTIPTARLPLLQPLRDLGVPEPLMALVEPALRVIIETGYDRTLSPGVPAPARLIPRIDLAQFAQDFFDAIEQGIADARAEIENPTPRPAGPTPTERVVTDLVQKNINNTVAGLGRLVGAEPYVTGSSADADATTQRSATEVIESSADAQVTRQRANVEVATQTPNVEVTEESSQVEVTEETSQVEVTEETSDVDVTEKISDSDEKAQDAAEAPEPRLTQKSVTKRTADDSTTRTDRRVHVGAESSRRADAADRDRQKVAADKPGDAASAADKPARAGDNGAED